MMDPDAVYDDISAWMAGRGIDLYPHQDEAMLELVSGNNVVLGTPTGSGKSLVAVAAHKAALADDRVSFYTAPIKALVSEKFFDLCEIFGPENVGMLTGDASVNTDAPVVCCTAEILANLALREGADADVGMVIMDEFHYYAEPDRGWAWQVPLLELPQAQFLLMSATLGDVAEIGEDLTRRNGRETAIIDDAARPVPLAFTWSMTVLQETIEEIVATHQAPAYVVHFTQRDAVEHATALLATVPVTKALTAEHKESIAQRLAGFRFSAGFGTSLSTMLRRGIGVHHAGMLPRYRRLVEQLAQAGLLTIVCGTDTLGVGINVPIRTVLFTGLAKYDGTRSRVLRTREFLQIAGRAGRAGFDTAGSVIVQAPEHAIENEKAKAKAAAKNAERGDGSSARKRRSKAQLKKPPEGTVVWTEQTFEKLVAGVPEKLVSRMRVTNAMLINVVAREEDAFAVMRRLVQDNHEDRRRQLQLSREALRLTRSLVRSGVLTRLDQTDAFGRRYVLTEALPEDFALNQPLAQFALASLELLDPESATYTLDIISVIESVLEGPRQILRGQQSAARGEAIAEMKADGVEYEERMRVVDTITWPQPQAEMLDAAFEIYQESHPWLNPHDLEPKAIVREMYEQAMSFTDFVRRYQLSRSEGSVLRYLTDAYRTLRHTVTDDYRTPELDDVVEWLGETVRQTDSSLLDEWEALSDPDQLAAVLRTVAEGAAPPSRPVSSQERAFNVMIRNAMFRRVELVARDDLDGLMAIERAASERTDPPGEVEMTRSAWDEAIEAYYAEHEVVEMVGDARSPELLHVEREGRAWRVRQTIADPAGHHDWVIEADLDLDLSDELGEAALTTTAMRLL